MIQKNKSLLGLILGLSMMAATNTAQAFGLSFGFGSCRNGVSVGFNLPGPRFVHPAPICLRPAPIIVERCYRSCCPISIYDEYEVACDLCYEDGYDYCDCPW